MFKDDPWLFKKKTVNTYENYSTLKTEACFSQLSCGIISIGPLKTVYVYAFV